MATVMLMHWREATPDEYDQVPAKVRWDEEVPEGAKLHVCGFAHAECTSWTSGSPRKRS